MKSLLTILLICFCFVGYGQVHSDTTTTVIGRRTTGGTDSIYSLLSTYTTSGLTFNSKPKYDTVKVIMLVCDTSTYQSYGWYSIQGGKLVEDVTERKIKSFATQWEYGYEVIKNYGFYTSSSDFYYLDENKKPLSKNIMVWDARVLISSVDIFKIGNSTKLLNHK